MATYFFQTLFTSEGVEDPSLVLEEIKPCVSHEENFMLIASYTAVEDFNVNKLMGPMKALRWDGFSVIFFQKYWYEIGSDVV